MSIEQVRGTQDLDTQDFLLQRNIVSQLQSWFELAGYRGIELPVLEETDLYLRKAGGDMLSKLYSFVEPGGTRVSLRPEFTASVARHFIQQDGDSARWHYAGPVFRFESGAALRQLYQQGVESLGDSGNACDAALLDLAIGGLARLGLPDTSLRIGHVGVVTEALGGFGLSERTRSSLLAAVGSPSTFAEGSGAVRERLRELGLTAEGEAATELKASLVALGDDGARTVVRGLLESINVDLLGGRDPDQIVGRLLRKLSGWDDPVKIERAVELVQTLKAVKGNGRAAVSHARSIFSTWNIRSASLDEFEDVLDRIGSSSARNITVDLGLTRELGYYSGIVFEVNGESADGPLTLAGGGRYDGLIRALGGRDVPAAGFAYSIDNVRRLAVKP